MDIKLALIAALVGYLSGSLSFSRMISAILDPDLNVEEVHTQDTADGEDFHFRAVGATTASMKLGGKVGCLIGWLDIFKVAVPTLVFRLLYPGEPIYLFSAIAGMAGHNWPLYHRFKGGAGVSSIYGGMLVIDWLGALVCSFAGLFIGLAVVKDLMVAYLAGVWLMIPWLWFRTRDPWHLAYILLANAFFMLSLIPEMKLVLKARREGRSDLANSMEFIPMGRGMLRIMKFFGIRMGVDNDQATDHSTGNEIDP